MIPLSFIISTVDAQFLRIESLDIVLNYLIRLALRQDLHNRLNKWQLELFSDCIEYTRQISPVMNFTQHALFRYGVF